MRPLRLLRAGVLIGLFSAACGGGSDGGDSSTSAPSAPSTPAANPCDSVRTAASGALSATAGDEASGKRRGPVLDRDPRYAIFDALWTHEAPRRGRPPQAFDARGATADIGEIAVIQDNGDIILPMRQVRWWMKSVASSVKSQVS